METEVEIVRGALPPTTLKEGIPDWLSGPLDNTPFKCNLLFSEEIYFHIISSDLFAPFLIIHPDATDEQVETIKGVFETIKHKIRPHQKPHLN